MSLRPRAAAAALLVCLLAVLGCRHTPQPPPTPAASGLNTRDLIDPPAQHEADGLAPEGQLAAAAERLRKERQQKLEAQSKAEGGVAATQPGRTVLCLSGGGCYGAYAAGVLVGWSEEGTRPRFDVVTGVSTGALMAPCAFLGPKYDARLAEFYTQVESKQVYTVRRFWGLFHESYADTSPLAARIDAFLTAEVMADLATAHREGRRLYVGTTEAEGKQFVVWDVTSIAARGRPCDRELIGKVLLASSAAPGYFPAVPIEVTVGGVPHTERHVDGGVMQSLFYRPPYVPPADRSGVAARDLAGAKVYVIVAGKLYADPEVIRPWSLDQAGKSVATLLYAQTRGDLQRLYTSCLVGGMDYFVTAIPPGCAAPASAAVFEPRGMSALFDEGRRVIASPQPWRVLPPGAEPGESVLAREGTGLTHRQRGPAVPIRGPKGVNIPPREPGPGRAAGPGLPPAPVAK